MNTSNRTGLTRTILAAVLVACAVSALAAPTVVLAPTKIYEGGTPDMPVVAVDRDGNAHVIWQSSWGYELFYKMLDVNGGVLIDTISVTPCDIVDVRQRHVRRPDLAVDSEGALHIVFHGHSRYSNLGAAEYGTVTDLPASEVLYTKITPFMYLAAGAIDIHDLIAIPETIISAQDSDKSRAPNIVCDPRTDHQHVVWYDRANDRDLMYAVLDTSGAPVLTARTLATGIHSAEFWGEPDVAVDPDGNAHVVYCTDGNVGSDQREIHYLMADGTTGAVLIDATRITDADGYASVRPHLAVDGNGQVHVVWHDKRLHDGPGQREHEVFYSKLDPSLDDQDGSTADPGTVAVISEVRLSADNDERSNKKHIAMDRHGRMHAVWVDDNERNVGDPSLCHAVFDTSGASVAVVEAESEVYDGDDSNWPCSWENSYPEIAVVYGRAFIVFRVADDSAGESDIVLGIFDVPAQGPLLTFPVASEDGLTAGSVAGDTFAFHVNYWATGAPATAELWIDVDRDGTYDAAGPAGVVRPPQVGPFGGLGLWALAALAVCVVYLASRCGAAVRLRPAARLAGVTVLVLAFGLVGLPAGCGGGGGGGGGPKQVQERFVMTATQPGDTNFADGKVYMANVILNAAGVYSYRIVFEDGVGAAAIGDPRENHVLTVN